VVIENQTLSTDKNYHWYQWIINRADTDTVTHFNKKTNTIIWELTAVKGHLAKCKSGLQLLNMGLFPSELVTPAMLEDTINEIGMH